MISLSTLQNSSRDKKMSDAWVEAHHRVPVEHAEEAKRVREQGRDISADMDTRVDSSDFT